MKKRKPALGVPRMSEADLKEFVRDYMAGMITVATQVPENVLAMVFMPLALGGAKILGPKKVRDQIGQIYGHRGKDRTTGQAINGYPIFFSCRVMHKDDWEIARKTINRELEKGSSLQLEK